MGWGIGIDGMAFRVEGKQLHFLVWGIGIVLFYRSETGISITGTQKNMEASQHMGLDQVRSGQIRLHGPRDIN